MGRRWPFMARCVAGRRSTFATLQGYFLPASLLGLAGYAILGLGRPAVTRYFFISLPAVIMAIVIGRFLNRELRGDAFFRIVFLGLIVLGSILVRKDF